MLEHALTVGMDSSKLVSILVPVLWTGGTHKHHCGNPSVANRFWSVFSTWEGLFCSFKCSSKQGQPKTSWACQMLPPYPMMCQPPLLPHVNILAQHSPSLHISSSIVSFFFLFNPGIEGELLKASRWIQMSPTPVISCLRQMLHCPHGWAIPV